MPMRVCIDIDGDDAPMSKYVVDPGGAWRRYHPMEVPKGWQMLGTVACEGEHSTGALARSPAGLYALINAGDVRMLDQHAVADALHRIKLTQPYRRGREFLLR